MGRAYGFTLRWWRMVENHPTLCTTSSGLHAASARTPRPQSRSQRVLELVTGDRRIDGAVLVATRLEPANGIHRGVEVREHAQHAGRRRGVENALEDGDGVQGGHAAPPLPRPRRGGASTSFTSEIETAGKFLANSRNHMKNQPKLPAMMPQSAQVGL